MEEKEAKQVSLELMKSVPDCIFGTVDGGGFPQVRVMANLRNKERCNVADELFDGHDEDFLVYMITSSSSEKTQQIRANSKATVYFYDSAEIQTLLLAGNIEEINDMDLKKKIWQDKWKIHWPDGPEDPNFLILKLLPNWAKGWCNAGTFEFKLK